ncbi:Crp/Fnr family transcriptional regulator [Mucilaginibacter gossypii]|uniref:cAMP-binding domain of CRP or a regulatory subunit of cAMP-dependent protein kinases n=1 Tax=Mucilaginibacter gossypii TaxID=551996 RepID=A0A1G8CUN3_9SPHI|nr:Crp/Fnr family transcriptional regulator [Mucilaginibacter gossypii]SDH49202.1 cAMP-binding domain of CRP or a regulatory subunit of cAMP-dependent protein kinases [Mucilaginibacter gossypii]
MDTKPITDFLNRIAGLSAGFIQEVVRDVKQEFYKHHQIIQAQGQPEYRLWYLNSGFARSYFYDDEGQEHTIRFWNEGEVIFSYAGFWSMPAMEYIEILESSELNPFEYEQLKRLLDKYPDTRVLVQFAIQQYLQKEQERHLLCSLPPEKRYLKLRQENPHIFKKAPLRMIASYLHMSRVSLSRIINRRRR